MSDLKKILYISYDGMTDPLGQSQVLPYLVGLSQEGYQFTILSFEKADRYQKTKQIIEDITGKAGIKWVPLSFTSRPPILSKFYDMVRMRNMAFRLQKKEHFDMVHCRSYVAADIGLSLKRKFGVKFFFDMRGFWADEKKDGGAWTDTHPVFSRVYKYYKQKESQYLQEADHIISLTEAGKKELISWPAYKSSIPVTVIPCCADMQHFSVTSPEQKSNARQLLGIGKEKLVISYLGSVGAWYLLDEMLDLFVHIKKAYPSAFFLFISHSDPDHIYARARGHQIKEDDILIKEATRQQVPVYMKASDITISFIKPVYSKISSSPTKLGEVLSMGIPVIVNSGVGDVEGIVDGTGGGLVIHRFDSEHYAEVITRIPELVKVDAESVRSKAASYFDLDKGVHKYREAYRKVFSDKGQNE